MLQTFADPESVYQKETKATLQYCKLLTSVPVQIFFKVKINLRVSLKLYPAERRRAAGPDTVLFKSISCYNT